MKTFIITFFTVLFCLTSSVGYSQNIICEKTGYGCPEIDYKDLVKRENLYFKKFTKVPFTGKVYGQEKGSMKNGKKDGSWVGYHDNGQLSFKGNYKNGKKDGSWVGYKDSGEVKYKVNFINGDWEKGSYNGQGTYTYWNGDKYEGEYKDGVRNGQGTYTYWNGNKYEGEYKDGVKNGQGTFTFSSGSKYVGQFKDDKYNGQGTFTYSDGDKMEL